MRRTYVRRRVTAALVGAAVLWLAVPAAARAFGGGEEPSRVRRYVVQPGDTLWEIAVRSAPQEDPREVVDAIVEMNEIGTILPPGQEVSLPRFD